MIDVVFLDAGETILRPHPSFEELFAATARSWGYDIGAGRVADVREAMAPHLIDLGAEDDDETSVTASGTSVSAAKSRSFWTHLYVRFLEGLGIDDEALAGALFATFSSSSSYKLYDDVLPALGTVRGSGHRLGLISNFERWLEDMLVELEVGELFDIAIISGVEGVEKPDPGIYELALERAGVRANGAVHVGDSMTFDIAPANAVGMHTVLLDRAGRYRGGGGRGGGGRGGGGRGGGGRGGGGRGGGGKGGGGKGGGGNGSGARPSATIVSLEELPEVLARL